MYFSSAVCVPVNGRHCPYHRRTRVKDAFQHFTTTFTSSFIELRKAFDSAKFQAAPKTRISISFVNYIQYVYPTAKTYFVFGNQCSWTVSLKGLCGREIPFSQTSFSSFWILCYEFSRNALMRYSRCPFELVILLTLMTFCYRRGSTNACRTFSIFFLCLILPAPGFEKNCEQSVTVANSELNFF